MENKKFHIERNTIQETLVIPLYARKLCTRLYPSIFSDPRSVELVDRLDYDFSAIEKKSGSLMQRFGSLEVAIRQLDLAIEVRDYLTTHPNAAVVNLGCGLDQTAETCDNGTCHMYNLDMPDVIAVRNELIPAADRVTNVPCDLNDHSWMDKIDGSQGAVFFASGVFYYFTIEQVKGMFNAMAVKFPGGRLALDTTNKAGLKATLKVVSKQADIENVAGFFHVDNLEKDVNAWLKHGKASQKAYMLGYHDLKEPCIPGIFRLISRVGDHFMGMQILRLDFDE